MQWHLLTGEYSPMPGGVADYTRLVAQGLAENGDLVTVWTPPSAVRRVSSYDGHVRVEVLPDHFGPRSLAHLSKFLMHTRGPRRLLVQYVPHAFGWKGGNVPFSLWLRSLVHESIWVMFHEVAFPIDRHQRLALNGLGLVTRGMASLVASAAERIFVSIPAWERLVRPSAATATPIDWLPVPSVIPATTADDRDHIDAIRQTTAAGRPLVGHFGTYGQLIQPLLAGALPAIVAATGANVLLLGRGSETTLATILTQHPELKGRLHAAGALDPLPLARHIAACDCLFQPYPDGVSTRRTSAMAALANGRPLVTTTGSLTETLWEETDAAVLCAPGDVSAAAAACAALVGDAATLARRSAAARALYDTRFDLRHTLAQLRDSSPVALRAVS